MKRETWIGVEVIGMLGLKQKPPKVAKDDSDWATKARYDTQWGTKSPLGLGRSIVRIVEESKAVKDSDD